MNNLRVLTIIYLFFHNMEDIKYDKNYKKRKKYTFRGIELCRLQQIFKIGFYCFSNKSVKLWFILRGIEINT